MRNYQFLFILLLITIYFLLYSCKKDDNDNIPPVAKFIVNPQHGTLQTIFSFDATGTHDTEDSDNNLLIRWDWENDGLWDTEWTLEKTHAHQFKSERNYDVKLEVKDNEGLINSTTQIVTIFKPCPESPTVSWHGQTYNTVLIETQCWMQENLNVGIMRHGPHSDNGIIEKRCYHNIVQNCDTSGGLYQWEEMMQYVLYEGSQGICPDGWHIPSYGEWKTLRNNHGGILSAGGKLKEAGTIHWDSPNAGATNVSGFSALPAGFSWKDVYEEFHYQASGMGTIFWSSTNDNGIFFSTHGLSYIVESFEPWSSANYEEKGYSVRCIKNQ